MSVRFCGMVLGLLMVLAAQVGMAEDARGGPYDENPEHLWNRLHQVLVVPYEAIERIAHPEENGLVRLRRTSTVKPFYATASKVLEEFLEKDAEALIEDPLRRSMLQHDLWAVFDYMAIFLASSARTEYLELNPGLGEFGDRLAKVIGRLALSKEEIESLDDNYAAAVTSKAYAAKFANVDAAYLPADLFEEDGPWVEYVKWQSDPVAPFHLQQRQTAGRAVTRLFMRLPAGRQATIAYLRRLREFPEPFVAHSLRKPQGEGQHRWDSQTQGMQATMMPNWKMPQFPLGTMVALVQQRLLIDRKGRLQVSPLTELVELRVYRKIGPVPKETYRLSHSAMQVDSQAGYRFRLERRKLVQGKHGGLVADSSASKEDGQKRPRTYNVAGEHQCSGCHNPPGVFSLRSQFPFDSKDVLRHGLFPVQGKNVEAGHTMQWKWRRFEWGLLTAGMSRE